MRKASPWRASYTDARHGDTNSVLVHLHHAAPMTVRLPVLVQNRPEHLVQIFPVLEERLAQHALLNGADLTERAVAAAVADRCPRLQAVNADGLERETHHELGSFLKDPGPPERRPDRESPLRRAEPGIQLAQLEDTDRRIRALQSDREARI